MTATVGVVGAGLMGAEIALVAALAGKRVLLNDRDEDILERAVERLRGLLAKAVERGTRTVDEVESALSRIVPTVDLSRFVEVGFATEAVYEDQAVKAGVLGELNRFCRADAIIVTNTSTIPISTLAAALPPERRPLFIGMHYFSPVSRMKLVEVIPAFETSDATIEAALSYCMACGKSPVRIKDVAGFAVNRMLHAFLIEAIRLVEEGVASPADLDIACTLGLGHPIGPFALMDAVTSSLTLQAQEIMQEAYGERFRPRPLLKQRVRAGLVGGKGRPGWHS